MDNNISQAVLDNAELNIREMKEKRTTLSSMPFKVFLEPTQRCNLRCFMCWDERRKASKDLVPGMFEKIEHELFPTAAEVDFFLVGEPLLYKNLPDILKRAEDYTFIPKIFTNGTVYDHRIYEMLVESGFFVNISTDAANKDLFESVRTGSNFDHFKANMGKLAEMGRQIGNRRFHIRLCATIGSYNIGEIPGILEMAASFGIRDVMVNDCDLGPPSLLSMNGMRDYAKVVLSKALPLASKLGIRFSFPRFIGGSKLLERNHNWDDFPLPIDEYAPEFLEQYNPIHGECPYPWIETVVRCDGTVVSCCQKLIPMGDLNKQSFRTIWNNKQYRKLRKRKSYYDCQGYCLLTRNSVWRGDPIR